MAVAVISGPTVTVTVRVRRSPVLEQEDAHEVDDEAKDGDDQKTLVLNFGRLN